MGKLKYTEDYIKQICEEKDLIFIDIDTVKFNQKSRRILYFICKNHIDKGIQQRPVEKVIENKKLCQYCNHSKLKETFKDEMEHINPNIEILSEYVNWNTKIKCRCKIDGYEWEGHVSTLLYGGGCKICGYKNLWDNRGRKTTQDFINEMALINPNINIVGEYVGSHKKVKCQCKIDNCEWESYACNLLNKSANCPECAKRNMIENESLSDDEFNKRLDKSNPNIISLSTYINNNTKMKFKCMIHNCEFICSPRNYLYKGGKGCPYCNQSSGERKMVSILEKRGFKIKQQYTFDNCVYIQKLQFDAYDYENHIAYEYQGQQHYMPIDFAGKGEDWAKENYLIGKKRDAIKIKYCKDNNIPLIEIPYWEYDDMEQFLENEIRKYI